MNRIADRDQIADRERQAEEARWNAIAVLQNTKVPPEEWCQFADSIETAAVNNRCLGRYKSLIADLRSQRRGQSCQIRAANALLELWGMQ